MLDVLKARRGLLRIFSITSFLLFILGLQVGLPHLLLAFVTFLLASPLSLNPPPCILPVYSGLRPSALLLIYFDLSKKERKKKKKIANKNKLLFIQRQGG